MSKYLPYRGFQWLSEEEIKIFDVNSVSENSLGRYILEVDLEYPDELHDLHNDYPLASEKLEIIMISCQNIVVIFLKNME